MSLSERISVESGRESHRSRRSLTDLLGWTKSSYWMISIFFAIVFLIVIVWWPLAEEVLSYIDPARPLWLQLDWLLLGIFLMMSLLIMAGADLRADVWIVFVGLAGGLVIESWGTQTQLWTYFTLERPPLWIIPAWPIASLSIDRVVRFLDKRFFQGPERVYKILYVAVFFIFLIAMVQFVYVTFNRSLTWAALLLCLFLIFTPVNWRLTLLTFAAGAGLGYFLELWGTTRECWTYYTHQTPPFFAVLAHGMAAVAFWRAGLVLKWGWDQLLGRFRKQMVDSGSAAG